jgi:uncharacterized membrane protein
MAWLIAGLVLFLGAHSVRIFADGWRAALITRLGDGAWKGLYSVVAGTGFGLIIYGFGQARDTAPLYTLPPHLLHVTFLLVWVGFVFLTAANWPANHIKHWVRDPMVAGVGLWALGHLLVNATPAALALFGGFLVWAVVDFVSLRRRGSPAGAAPKILNTVLVVITGTVLYAVFAAVLHVRWIGVSPMAHA